MLALQRNATRGRRIAGTCHMHEDGAAGAPHARHPVVVQHDDDVVKAVRAPQTLGAGGIGMANQAIVVAVAGGIAPAVAAADRAHGQARRWAPDTIRAVQHAKHAPAADRRRAVAFPLARAASLASERARQIKDTKSHNAARRSAGQAEDQGGRCRVRHGPRALRHSNIASAQAQDCFGRKTNARLCVPWQHPRNRSPRV
jgi:hypothetical protein